MIFKKKLREKEDDIPSLLAERLDLEKKIEILNEKILALQMKCPHENFSDFDRLDGHGYTVCTDCYADLVRLY